MKLKNKMIIVLDHILSNKRRFCFEVILLVLSYCLFSYGLLIKEFKKNYRVQLEEAFGGTLDRIVRVQSKDGKNYKELYNYFLKRNEINGVSKIDCEYYPDSIIEMQSKYGNTNNTAGIEYANVKTVQPEMFKLFNIRLSDGRVWAYEEIEKRQKESMYHGQYVDSRGKIHEYDMPLWYGVYLGNDYNDIPVGTQIISDEEDYIIICEVLGHIEAHSKIPEDSRLNLAEGEYTELSMINLDTYTLFIGNPGESGGDMLFCVNEGYSIEDIITDIYDKFDLYSERLDDVILRTEMRQNKSGDNSLKLFFLIAVVSISLIFCFELICIINNKKTYGILLANGLSIREMVFIQFIEVLIKFIISSSVGIGMFIILIYKCFYNIENAELYKLALLIYKKYVFGESLFTILGVLILGNILPIIWLYRYKPVDLYKEVEYEHFLSKYLRDEISSLLLICTLALSIFAIYNFSDVVGRYIQKEKRENKYSNSIKGKLEYNYFWDENGIARCGEEDWVKKEDVWYFINGINQANISRKYIYKSSVLDDGVSYIKLIFDFSDGYTNDIEKFYDTRKKYPGVYVSKEMESNIITQSGKKYILFDGMKYLVKGIYKDMDIQHTDYRIVVPWNNLNNNEKNYYVKEFTNDIMSNGMGICLESNGDIGTVIALLDKIAQRNNLILNVSNNKHVDKAFIIYGSIAGIMIIFSFINSLTVISVWIIRRRNELMIKKTWGMSEWMIYGKTLLKLLKHLLASIPLVVIFQITYIYYFKESVIVNIYKYICLNSILIIMLLVISYVALLRIRKLKPAEGLRGE